ncbi:MAG: glycosyltransferase [Lachnospiraceae bacterium]|nr:glycosyltransferase [Lachnospiraceae bacterium]
MTIVTPSKWLENLVKGSFLKEYRTEVIYNTIDTKVFQPIQSDFREQYGLKDKRIILGVANVWEKRKGLDDFIKLAGMLDERYAIVLVGLSERLMKSVFKRLKEIKRAKGIHAERINIHETDNQKKSCMAISPGIESLYMSIVSMFGNDIQESEQIAAVICLKRTESAKNLAQIYTAADVFVNPTYEDNYPTVNLEALACGTRVITYDVGGCRETIGL